MFDYTMVIICGLTPKEYSNPQHSSNQNLNELTCPYCLDTMHLSSKQMNKIFHHDYVEDFSERLDIMCSECMNEYIHENVDELFSKKLKIIPAT